jgi:hypothetical protein
VELVPVNEKNFVGTASKHGHPGTRHPQFWNPIYAYAFVVRYLPEDYSLSQNIFWVWTVKTAWKSVDPFKVINIIQWDNFLPQFSNNVV